MNRWLVRSVRRATPDRPGAHRANRSITDGWNTTSGRQVQAQPETEVGELARRPQQVLRPFLAARGHRRDHLPGERRGLRRY
jgi:hypothetical protein